MNVSRVMRSILLVTVAGLACGSLRSQELSDLIPPLNIHAGRSDSIVVSDLFYAKGYDVRFLSHAHMDITYNPQSNVVVFRPEKGFVGATIVDFTLGGKDYALPMYIRSEGSNKQLHVFRYASSTKPARVTVTGSFNSWNKSSDELRDPKGVGSYELNVPLDPGSYLY